MRDSVNMLGIDVNCFSIAPAACWFIADAVVVVLLFSLLGCFSARLSVSVLSVLLSFLVNLDSNNMHELVNIRRLAEIVSPQKRRRG